MNGRWRRLGRWLGRVLQAYGRYAAATYPAGTSMAPPPHRGMPDDQRDGPRHG
ncbi:hypothetical protein AB0F72_34460 [Actinoplanes sp. NPDC023936]|uniref:hypothetical protein n=1 Tax=Actinoplanes sp. NPDC023936 TaxID=3154910 RepID=UPI0034117239